MHHGAYTEGLNYVPFLTQSHTPPSSSRTSYSQSNTQRRSSTISLPRALSTALCYNGNYEGDASMFGHRRKPTAHLLINDTDSETEYENCMRDVLLAKRFGVPKSLTALATENTNTTSTSIVNANTVSTTSIITTSKDESQFMRLCKHYMHKHVPPQCMSKITAIAERLQQNRLCCKLYEMLCFLLITLLWLMRWLVGRVVYLHNCTHQWWRGKTVLRNAARHLLWWMTLAKFKDITYFVLILVATPPLFIVALFGLALSLYCAVKDYICRSADFLRHRVF